jgi:hypothetical protein
MHWAALSKINTLGNSRNSTCGNELNNSYYGNPTLESDQ